MLLKKSLAFVLSLLISAGSVSALAGAPATGGSAVPSSSVSRGQPTNPEPSALNEIFHAAAIQLASNPGLLAMGPALSAGALTHPALNAALLNRLLPSPNQKILTPPSQEEDLEQENQEKLKQILEPFIRQDTGEEKKEEKNPAEDNKEQDKKEPAKTAEKSVAEPAAPAPVAPVAVPAKPKEPTFEDFFKDAKVYKGLFTIYEVEGKKPTGIGSSYLAGFPLLKPGDKRYYMEIRPDQLKTNFHFLPTLERGTGENGIFSGLLLFGRDFVWFFDRKETQVEFSMRNVNLRVQAGSEAKKLVEKTFPDSTVMRSVDILADKEHPERKSVFIDMSSLFLNDWAEVGGMMNRAYGSYFSLNTSESKFESVESYPQNVEILNDFVFTGGKPTVALARSGPVHITVRYSLSALPDAGYEPRAADSRVGNFMSVFQDFSDLKQSEKDRRLINRWHLVKENPYEAVSVVKNPIVWHLDPQIPKEYRDSIAAGILAWNKAFEAIGLKGAIQVKDIPHDADWKPGDTRFNVIRWFTSAGGPVYAAGPFRANPLTGQIYQASIAISDWMTRGVERQAEDLSALAAGTIPNKDSFLQLAKQMDAPKESRPAHCCELGQHAGHEMASAMAALEARGELNAETKKKMVGEFLTWLAQHEVGHTLGFRHNFKGSTAFNLEDIVSGKTGPVLGGSVMDYMPPNIAPKGAAQGQFFQTEPGPTDKANIAYSYTPLENKTAQEQRDALNKIAARFSAEKELTYGTDEDVMVGKDPNANVWDLGSNPLAYQKLRLEQVNEVLESLEKKELKGDYKETRRHFISGLNQYIQAMDTARKHLGGVYYQRTKPGDPGKRTPFEPVAAERQREAVALLNDYVFKKGALEFSPQLLRKLDDESLPTVEDWPMPDNLPMHRIADALRWRALVSAYHPQTLQQIKDNESMTEAGKGYGAQEHFKTLRESIWSELSGNGKLEISSSRRSLQQNHLKVMGILLESGNDIGAPLDTRGLARHDLETLAEQLDTALTLKTREPDASTRMHLRDVRETIRQILNPR